MAEPMESIDNNSCNSNGSNANTNEDKTYHFRKGNDLEGFESFGTLFADGLFTDLAICCSGKVFRCHRVVMAASSPYMKSALSAFSSGSNASSPHHNCNAIMFMPQDIRVQDMEAILHFIYNGQVEVTRDAIESFLTSAKLLNIKGLANIKLVYNNQNNHNNNHNNRNNNHNNHNYNHNNNENENNENHNHKNQNNNNHKNSNNKNQNNNNNNNNNNINSNDKSNNCNDNNMKRRNGFIASNGSQLKNDLNFSLFNTMNTMSPQIQSFNSDSEQMDVNSSQSNRRKQSFPSNSPMNGMTQDSADDESQWITITDEEEEDVESDNKTVAKVEENEQNSGEEMSQELVPQMPCLIQIDADPTTFPSYCPETNDNAIKRRRSSSLKSLPDMKSQRSGNSSVKISRNSDQLVRKAKKSGLRKHGFSSISLHKISTSMWSSNKWKCEICNKLYGNKQTLKEHMDYFHSNRTEQIFTCSICTKEYTWKKSLMKHYRDIHQIHNNSLSDTGKADASLVTNANSSQG